MDIEDQDVENYQLFSVLIGNAKIIEEIEFHLRAPMLKYHQESYNSCCLSSPATAFHIIDKNKAADALANRID